MRWSDIRTSIATGENHYHKLNFQSLVVNTDLRVLSSDVQKLGICEGRKLADLADLRYVNLRGRTSAGL